MIRRLEHKAKINNSLSYSQVEVESILKDSYSRYYKIKKK